MFDLVDVVPGEKVSSARQNLINAYIQHGTHKINTKSVDIQGVEVITEEGKIDFGKLFNVPSFLNKDSSTTDDLVEGLVNKYDKVVSLTAGTNISIGGSYPSFIINNTFVESDPVFTAWDKSTGISIKESQVSDLKSYQVTSEKGVANGYAGLDNGAKIPLQNLPSTLLKYMGVWDPVTNTPELVSPDLNKIGFVYNVGAVGSRFGYDWNLGDWAIYNESGVIELSKNSDDVVKVNNKTGTVELDLTDMFDVDDTNKGEDKTLIVNSSGDHEYIDFKLNKLKDVDTTGITEGSTLQWDDTEQKWITSSDGGDINLDNLSKPSYLKVVGEFEEIKKQAIDNKLVHGSLCVNDKIYITGNLDSPSILTIINDLDDLTDISIVTLPDRPAPAMCYDEINNRIYILAGNKIVSLNPNDDSIETVYTTSGTNVASTIGTNGEYVYVTANTGYVRKVKISDWSLQHTFNFGQVIHAVCPTEDKTHMLFTSQGDNNSFFKVNVSTNEYEQVILNIKATDDFVVIGDYAYLGSEVDKSITKINWKTLHHTKIITDTSYHFISYDGKYVYGGALDNYITILDPKTNQFISVDVPVKFNEMLFNNGRIFVTDYVLSNSSLYEIKFKNKLSSDIPMFVPYKFATEDVDLGDKNIIANNLSGINTGDQDLSKLVPYENSDKDVDLSDNSIRAKSFNISVKGHILITSADDELANGKYEFLEMDYDTYIYQNENDYYLMYYDYMGKTYGGIYDNNYNDLYYAEFEDWDAAEWTNMYMVPQDIVSKFVTEKTIDEAKFDEWDSKGGAENLSDLKDVDNTNKVTDKILQVRADGKHEYVDLPDPDVSGLVPYTGAEQDVDLGTKELDSIKVSAGPKEHPSNNDKLKVIIGYDEDIFPDFWDSGHSVGIAIPSLWDNSYARMVNSLDGLGNNGFTLEGETWLLNDISDYNKIPQVGYGIYTTAKIGMCIPSNPIPYDYSTFATKIDGSALINKNTYGGYFENTSAVSGSGKQYGIYSIGAENYFSGNVQATKFILDSDYTIEKNNDCMRINPNATKPILIGAIPQKLSLNENDFVGISKYINSNNGTARGLLVWTEYESSTSRNDVVAGINSFVHLLGNGDITVNNNGGVSGGRYTVRQYGNSTITFATGIDSTITWLGSGKGEFTTATLFNANDSDIRANKKFGTLYGLNLNKGVNVTGGIVDNRIGINIESGTKSSGTFTNQYGIVISELSGATNNREIWIKGDGAVYFGDNADVSTKMMPIVINHDDDDTVARPSSNNMVMWVGSVEPTNMENGDLWIETQ